MQLLLCAILSIGFCPKAFSETISQENEYHVVDLKEMRNKVTKATSLFYARQFEDALDLFNSVCFTMVPEKKYLEFAMKYMSKDELCIFCDALEGRLRALHTLNRYTSENDAEMALLTRMERLK